MLAKITAKNQLTLPKSVMSVLGDSDYVEVQALDGQIILTPVRIQRADAIRAKLAQLGITEDDVSDAVGWARDRAAAVPMAAEPRAAYGAGDTPPDDRAGRSAPCKSRKTT